MTVAKQYNLVPGNGPVSIHGPTASVGACLSADESEISAAHCSGRT